MISRLLFFLPWDQIWQVVSSTSAVSEVRSVICVTTQRAAKWMHCRRARNRNAQAASTDAVNDEEIVQVITSEEDIEKLTDDQLRRALVTKPRGSSQLQSLTQGPA